MSLAFQCVSDLHLEFEENFNYFVNQRYGLVPKGDVLIVAGDLAYLQIDDVGMRYNDDVMKFIDVLSDNWKYVYIVPGNHEFYGEKSPSICDLPSTIKFRDNVTLLNNCSDVIEYGGMRYVIYGGTMWTYPSKENYSIIRNRMNDYKRIKWNDSLSFNPGLAIIENNKFTDNLKQSLGYYSKKDDIKTIVVSHHCPLLRGMKNWYHCPDLKKCGPWEKREYIPLSEAYYTDMSNVIESIKPNLWIYGHTHATNSFKYKDTKFVENSQGYLMYYQNPNFNNKLVIL